MPMAQDTCPLQQALPYVRTYTGQPLPLPIIIVGKLALNDKCIQAIASIIACHKTTFAGNTFMLKLVLKAKGITSDPVADISGGARGQPLPIVLDFKRYNTNSLVALLVTWRS